MGDGDLDIGLHVFVFPPSLENKRKRTKRWRRSGKLKQQTEKGKDENELEGNRASQTETTRKK